MKSLHMETVLKIYLYSVVAEFLGLAWRHGMAHSKYECQCQKIIVRCPAVFKIVNCTAGCKPEKEYQS